MLILVTNGITVNLSLLPHCINLALNMMLYMFIIISFIWQVMFYGLAVVTFGTAVPAGQFVPGIMIGSTYGRLVGMFVVKYYRKLNIEEGT